MTTAVGRGWSPPEGRAQRWDVHIAGTQVYEVLRVAGFACIICDRAPCATCVRARGSHDVYQHGAAILWEHPPIFDRDHFQEGPKGKL